MARRSRGSEHSTLTEDEFDCDRTVLRKLILMLCDPGFPVILALRHCWILVSQRSRVRLFSRRTLKKWPSLVFQTWWLLAGQSGLIVVRVLWVTGATGPRELLTGAVLGKKGLVGVVVRKS